MSALANLGNRPGCRTVPRWLPWLAVVFYDVKKGRSIGREYGIRLIPSQIFLEPDGTEFFRHEGYFSLEEVAEVPGRMGITR